MGVTQIDIDGEALAEAMRLSGETTEDGVVNLALREYVAQRRRAEALDAAAKGVDFEGWERRREAKKQTPR
jgi:Arc/MetJ family transcription regulator